MGILEVMEVAALKFRARFFVFTGVLTLAITLLSLNPAGVMASPSMYSLEELLYHYEQGQRIDNTPEDNENTVEGDYEKEDIDYPNYDEYPYGYPDIEGDPYKNGENGYNGYEDDYKDTYQYEALEPWLTRRELAPRQLGITVEGDVPWLLPAIGDVYEEINNQITTIVDELLLVARRTRARSITFYYEVYPTEDMVSILIRATISSVIERTYVRSVNFCPYSGQILTLREAMQPGILSLAERILAERLRTNPREFYGVASTSLDNQAFFVTYQGLTILFDEFQLSSLVSGVFPLKLLNNQISIANVSNFMLLPTDHAYNITMVPLRHVAEQLGYDLEWVEAYNRVIISRDGQLVSWLYPDVNEYHTNNFTRSLEAAPYRFSTGLIYVPITFFEHILPLSVYTIDSFGNITFLAFFD